MLEGVRVAPKPLHKNIAEVKGLKEFSEETLSEEDIHVILDSEEEVQRRGHFEKIFPMRDTCESYERYFDCARYYNALLWSFLKAHPSSLAGC